MVINQVSNDMYPDSLTYDHLVSILSKRSIQRVGKTKTAKLLATSTTIN